MLLPVFSSPGSLGTLALQAVCSLAEIIAGPHQVIATHSGDEFVKAWQERQSDQVILFSDSPDVKLSDLVVQAAIPCVAFLEPPSSIVETVWEIASRDLWPARARALSLATLHDLALSPSTMVVRGDEHMSPQELLTSLAGHYRLPAASGQIEQAVAHLGWSEREKDAPIFTAEPVPVPAGEGNEADACWQEPVAEAFAGFAALLGRRSVDRLSWPPPFFHAVVKGEQGPLTGEVELIGPARTIIWGPYLNLPSGRWTAHVVLSCARNTEGCRMGGDVYSNVVHASWEYVLPEEGTYAFDVTFDVAEPRNGIEMRFFLREGVIDGTFELKSVTLSRSG